MAQPPALDETVWQAPQFFQSGDPFWASLNSNNVHFYFHESPFFDRMSNNSAIEQQAKVDPSKHHLLGNRKLFEQAVRDIQSGGLEFMIVSEPQQNPDGTNNETFMMQKQHRRKATGEPDELTVLGQWMIVGIDIIQAPSVFDVLATRFLSTALNLNKFINAASTLPLFTPATGHSYLPPTSNKGGPQSASQSRASTPPPDISSQLSQSKKVGTAPQSDKGVEASLFEALMTSIRFGGEYMDENPLNGEPGAFVFQSTNAHIRQQQEAQAKAAATMKAMQESVASNDETNGKSQSDPQRSPAAKRPAEKGRASIAAAKKRDGASLGRRKSKAPISPIVDTPT